jgi:type I restriction enzyme R subunit
MFLTGFDATTLNTLWVDKNLRQHGLIQAFSRTNRILNSVKTYGNIVCFRNLEQATNDAISLFGNKEAGGVVLLRPYQEYYQEYLNAVVELQAKYSPSELPTSEEDQKEFIAIYNTILRLKNILVSFDDFTGNEVLSAADFQDFQSVYLQLYTTRPKPEKESILDDIVFEIELVKQVEINVDYILMLVKQLKESKNPAENKELKATIDRAVSSSISLRSKRDLIDRFIESLNTDADVVQSWNAYIYDKKKEELSAIIQEERLDPSLTQKFIDQAFNEGEVKLMGTAFSKILPPKDMFTPDNEHGQLKNRVAEKIQAFFDRFFVM